MHRTLPFPSTSNRPSDKEKIHKMVHMVVWKYQRQQEKCEKVHNVPQHTLGGPDLWQERFDELVEFKKKHGHCHVPSTKLGLGRWTRNQRYLYQQYQKWKKEIQTYRVSRVKKCISKVRMDLMSELGFEWNPDQRKWDFMFQELLCFQRQNGHCNVPQTYSPNMRLGRWVHQQRFNIRKTMPHPSDEIIKRILMLEWIGFNWGYLHNTLEGLEQVKQVKRIANRYSKYRKRPPITLEKAGNFSITEFA